MKKIILFSTLGILIVFSIFVAYQNIDRNKYIRARHDLNWLRQLAIGIDSYKTKFGNYPDDLSQLIGVDDINESTLISRQCISRKIKLPHYVYIKPNDAELNSLKPMIYLRPECNEINFNKTLVGFQDGHIGVEIINVKNSLDKN